MQEQEFDMEVTPYRAIKMMETLVKLYADQMGMTVEELRIYQKDENGNKGEMVFEERYC